MSKIELIQNRYLTDVRFIPINEPFEKQEKDPILNSIYAVDPLTGKPASDLSVVYSSNTPEDVRQYIRTQLAVAQNSLKSAPDLETSEVSVKRAFETRQQYIDRITEFVQNNYKSENVE